MRKRNFVIGLFLCPLIFLSCEQPSKPEDIDYEKIEKIKSVLQKDLIILDNEFIPGQIIDSLVSFKAIILGEFHTVKEERELVGHLAAGLSRNGQKTEICAECPDAYSWIYEAVSSGEINALPSWAEYTKMLPILDSSITYLQPDNVPITIHCIDANMQPQFFSNSINGYSDLHPDNTNLSNYLQNHFQSLSTGYEDSLNNFYNLLVNSPETLGFQNDKNDLKITLRMTRNEITSYDIRQNWETDYSNSFNNRETLIKTNADYYLSKSEGTIVFYFGLNHVQKHPFLGSQIEWLGNYLHYSSPYSRNNTISIVGVPLKGVIMNTSNNKLFNFNLVTDSRPDDIFRIIGEMDNNHYSWLSLTDSIFINTNIYAKYIYDNYEVYIPLKEQYDAYLIIPQATYAGN